MLLKFLNLLPINFARRLVTNSSATSLKRHQSQQKILVDISILAKNDANTGIQRVVRKFLEELIAHSQQDSNFAVVPIYATRKRSYRYVVISDKNFLCTDKYVKINAGDVFLGLDWSAHILSKNESTLYKWKKKGVRLFFVLYDGLPRTNPEWFTSQTVKKYKRWLNTITIYGDRILCISNFVKQEYFAWLEEKRLEVDLMPEVDVISLGGDFHAQASYSSVGVDWSVLEKIEDTPYVLMVGTVEPRKGHKEVLDAFNVLWSNNKRINLVFAGQPGWGTQDFQAHIKRNQSENPNFFWLSKIDDLFLNTLYEKSCGVVVASKGEGFGLPIVEALYHKKKVLVRDIPVFREVGGAGVTFFGDDRPEALANAIWSWSNLKTGNAEAFTRTWQNAGANLVRIIKSECLGKD